MNINVSQQLFSRYISRHKTKIYVINFMQTVSCYTQSIYIFNTCHHLCLFTTFSAFQKLFIFMQSNLCVFIFMFFCVFSFLEKLNYVSVQFSSVQSLSRVRLFVTPRITACQASLSINSRSSPKLMSIESVMPSSHLILHHPLLLLPPIPPSIRVFSNESTLRMRWQSIGVSASALVLPKNTQD